MRATRASFPVFVALLSLGSGGLGCGEAFTATGGGGASTGSTSTDTAGPGGGGAAGSTGDGGGGAGQGGATGCVPEDDGNDCTKDVCVNGMVAHPKAVKGAACAQDGGKVCDGQGACVECNGIMDCPALELCQEGYCIAPSCEDLMQNGTETDKDCGGDCKPCVAGKHCLEPTDCFSKVCTEEQCQAPKCGDEVKNGDAEQCDDGNEVEGDGCDSNCTLTTCGNGIVTGSEECDDGNANDGDDCDSNCTVTKCGNGIITEGEECDDGNEVDGDGCDAVCVKEV